jgi:hypothetical protein
MGVRSEGEHGDARAEVEEARKTTAPVPTATPPGEAKNRLRALTGLILHPAGTADDPKVDATGRRSRWKDERNKGCNEEEASHSPRLSVKSEDFFSPI